MRMSDEQKHEIYSLLNALCENTITDEQFSRLETLLRSEPEAREVYADFMSIWSNLMYFQASLYCNKRENAAACLEMLSDSCDFTDSAIWKAMAKVEKEAPAIEPKPRQVPRPIIQKVERPKVEYRISKGTIISIIAASAAVVFLVLFAQFVPPRAGSEVATLIDSINAQWVEQGDSMQNGTRFAAGYTDYLLKDGVVKLMFDNGTRVTLEAPAEFRVLGDDQVSLRYGRFYAAVPQGAIGFTVHTPSARIIDLGTEFGIWADVSGDTALHVSQGKTALIAGSELTKTSVNVGAGQAKKVAGDTLAIAEIAYREGLFVRDINSRHNVVWKGQMAISLADIVGGGNGFGTGTLDMGIDPMSGKPSSVLEGRRGSSSDYRRVHSNPYIDGVFVPDGRTKQFISSEGHVFEECPATSGLCCSNITYALRTVEVQEATNSTAPVSSEEQCLLMHSNSGITFDLQAIRGLLPNVNIVRFQSKFGIEKWAIRSGASNADVWILVDGQLKYQKEQVKINELHSADIEISENDRFLTLVITEGDDPQERIWDDMVLTPIDSDWGMFVDPVLMLESK